jgi:hypothetical protein
MEAWRASPGLNGTPPASEEVYDIPIIGQPGGIRLNPQRLGPEFSLEPGDELVRPLGKTVPGHGREVNQFFETRLIHRSLGVGRKPPVFTAACYSEKNHLIKLTISTSG